jgi:hypothetical protein
VSYKTRELAKLFPEAYASDDVDSLLYKLLDVIGAELMVADEKIKRLLKSHWVNYASGNALDGLGAIYGVQRRLLPEGTPEPDSAFRLRLKSVVPLFAGGGTKKAVKGAVRSALGLPFDLDKLNLPADYLPLRRDLENLITLEEFSPKTERLVVKSGVDEVEGASELTLVVDVPSVDIPSVKKSRPRIRWTFPSGGERPSGNGRRLSLELAGARVGVKSKDALLLRSGESLILSATANGNLSAAVGVEDKSGSFTNLDGTEPAIMPEVPLDRSEWKFRAHSGLFDISTFDDDTYDLPHYEIEMSWTRYEPLSFDVHVPYFFQAAVEQLEEQHHYDGGIFAFQGLPLETIQEVVDQTRAAGVRGHVHFSLNWAENHGQTDTPRKEDFDTARKEEKPCPFRIEASHRAPENAGAADSLDVGSFNREAESQDLSDTFVLGGVWDVSTFDGSYGFQ